MPLKSSLNLAFYLLITKVACVFNINIPSEMLSTVKISRKYFQDKCFIVTLQTK